MEIKARNDCRICGSALTPVLSLGNQLLGNNFPSPKDNLLPSAPLELVRCDTQKNKNACGLIQLRHTVPGALLYAKYWYRSGINQTMKDHLKNIATEAEKIVDLKTGDTLLDIGCNDGTLLLSYLTKGIRRIGIDPAKNITLFAKKKGIDIVNDFFSSEVFYDVSKKKAKIITSIAMFYDLDDPNEFVSDLKKVLHEEGLWVMEQSYLPSMLNQNSFDTICHEHLGYYSLSPVEFLLKKHDLEAVDIDFNEINGGSFRLYIMHKGKREPSKKLIKTRKEESMLKLTEDEPYQIFKNNVEKIRTRLRKLIKTEHNYGKRIFIYGASTKGNTILQYCNLDRNLIEAAADRNPQKWGKVTPGTNIPIISEEDARAENPDYFLVLPWHFIKEFIKREAKYLKEGGKFIVPLPKVRIIDKNTLF